MGKVRWRDRTMLSRFVAISCAQPKSKDWPSHRHWQIERENIVVYVQDPSTHSCQTWSAQEKWECFLGTGVLGCGCTNNSKRELQTTSKRFDGVTHWKISIRTSSGKTEMLPATVTRSSHSHEPTILFCSRTFAYVPIQEKLMKATSQYLCHLCFSCWLRLLQGLRQKIWASFVWFQTNNVRTTRLSVWQTRCWSLSEEGTQSRCNRVGNAFSLVVAFRNFSVFVPQTSRNVRLFEKTPIEKIFYLNTTNHTPFDSSVRRTIQCVNRKWHFETKQIDYTNFSNSTSNTKERSKNLFTKNLDPFHPPLFHDHMHSKSTA